MEDNFASLGNVAGGIIARLGATKASENRDQYFWWRNAVKDRKPVDTEPGNPRSGYYRVKNEAIAIWRDDDGFLACWRSGNEWPTPTESDKIDELFSWCAPHPVSYDDFIFFQQNDRWPDEVVPPPAPVVTLNPRETLEHELTSIRDQAKSWIAEIVTVKSKADADKSANFADAFAKIEKRAEQLRKAEKEPHLEAGRAVDAAWKPLVERASECKTWSKKAAEAWLLAERKRLADEEAQRKLEAAKAAAEAERLRREAEAAGAPPPVIDEAFTPPPPPQTAKAGTSGRKISIRTRTIYDIVDLRAVLGFIADMNNPPQDLISTLQVIVNRMSSAGVKVPGVETKIIEEVA